MTEAFKKWVTRTSKWVTVPVVTLVAAIAVFLAFTIPAILLLLLISAIGWHTMWLVPLLGLGLFIGYNIVDDIHTGARNKR